ncbi:MAG: hypothetical protein H7256_11085 [Bdellovibrio sp.]|nr:hypothetical protein [Bdellovibrio sp.]
MKLKIDIQRHPVRYSFLILFGFALLMAFQNCNRTAFFSTTVAGGLFGNYNNGAGYGGKPSQDYARFTPGFKCENRESAVANILSAENTLTITENKKDICGAVQQTLDAGQIDVSIYQDEIIGYQEGIFEGVPSVPTTIPANLVEVWCRDTNDQSGIETITHFDHLSSLAVNRIYFASADATGTLTNKVVKDFSVARVVSKSKVTISDGSGFDLNVYRDQPAPLKPGLFVGQLNATMNGIKYERKTYCRFGGSLDAKVWPVKQIVDLNVSAFKQTVDLNYFSYSSLTGAGPAPAQNLFISKSNGANSFLVSKEISSNNLNFSFGPDSKNLFYATGASTTPVLMSAPMDGSSSRVLATVTEIFKFKLSTDGSRLIYNGYVNGAPGLRSVPSAGGNNSVLSPPVAVATMGASAMDVTKDKVVFLCCNTPTDIYINNFDGTALTKIPRPVLPANWDFSASNLSILRQQKAVSVWAWTWIAPGGSANYIIAIDGSWSLKLPTGWLWVSTSPDDLNGLLVNQTDPSLQALVNFKTGAIMTLPTLNLPKSASLVRDGSQTIESAFFAADSKSFIGVKANSNLNNETIAVSLIDGSVSSVCAGVTSSYVKQMNDGSLLLVGFDSSKRIINVYLRQADEKCKLVNSIPFAASKMESVEISISPDAKNILANVGGLDLNAAPLNLLLYIPLNGKVSYAVNTPVYSAATIQKAVFLNDSKTVIFIGDQIRSGDQNIFLWSAP